LLHLALRKLKEALRFLDAIFAKIGSAAVLALRDQTKNPRPTAMPQKLLVDCTYIYSTNINTGIQRVVRNIVENLEKHTQQNAIELVPVALVNGSLIRLSKDEITSFRQHSKWINLLQRVERKIRLYLSSFFVNETLYEEDILLMLDSSWHLHVWSSIAYAKKRGVTIVGIVYDIIPLTHPQFCDDTMERYFRAWYLRSLDFFDGYIAISQTVKDGLIDFFEMSGADSSKYAFDSFSLGADFGKDKNVKEDIRPSLVTLFKEHPSIYLTVSTIEPRKNHRYIFETFKKLWGANIDAGWLIIGRVGWKTEELLEEICQNEAYGERMWAWSDLSDAELRYCYNHSKALLFASYVEGYGLPIIEALHNGLPVLASDIPIHKEVGKSMVEYFDITKSDALVELISEIENHKRALKSVDTNQVSLATWDKSAQELLGKLVILSQEKRVKNV